MRDDVANKEGYVAYWNGMDFDDDNPYTDQDDRYEDWSSWRTGWLEAQEEDEENKLDW